MNYCPECGGDVKCTGFDGDVATTHYYYTCLRSGCEMKWEETRTGSIEPEILHISPVKEDDDES